MSNASPIYKADLPEDEVSETPRRGEETDVFYGKLGLDESAINKSNYFEGNDLLAINKEEIMTILEGPSTNHVSEMASKASSFEAQSDTSKKPGAGIRAPTRSMHVVTEKDNGNELKLPVESPPHDNGDYFS